MEFSCFVAKDKRNRKKSRIEEVSLLGADGIISRFLSLTVNDTKGFARWKNYGVVSNVLCNNLGLSGEWLFLISDSKGYKNKLHEVEALYVNHAEGEIVVTLELKRLGSPEYPYQETKYLFRSYIFLHFSRDPQSLEWRYMGENEAEIPPPILSPKKPPFLTRHPGPTK